MFLETSRRWTLLAALLGVVLAGCSPARRGELPEGGEDGFHAAGWEVGEVCPAWQEGGEDGFAHAALQPAEAACAAGLAPPAGVPGLAWGPMDAGEDDDPRLLPGELAGGALAGGARSIGVGRRPLGGFGADLAGPYLLLWPGAATAGQGDGAGGTPAGSDDAGPAVETIPAGPIAPILAPRFAASIPEPATMALLGAALVGLGLWRRRD